MFRRFLRGPLAINRMRTTSQHIQHMGFLPSQNCQIQALYYPETTPTPQGFKWGKHLAAAVVGSIGVGYVTVYVYKAQTHAKLVDDFVNVLYGGGHVEYSTNIRYTHRCQCYCYCLLKRHTWIY